MSVSYRCANQFTNLSDHAQANALRCLYDITTGDWSSFPFGYANCVIVGLFGWGRVPPDLVRLATAWASRSFKARNSGDADVLGTTEFGEQIISDRFPAQWRATIDSYRIAGWIT